MKIGCFALIDPFSPIEHQLSRIKDLGFDYADITENNDGGTLGTEYGFSATISLDANPYDVHRKFREAGLTPTAYCAHANLLDPVAPWRYSTAQIMKAIKAAALMGIQHVITTEGEPKTEYGHLLTEKEKLFLIRDRLYEPLRLAGDAGVRILLEPHGILTDSVTGMEKILDVLNNPENVGVNLDTGNSWLGGTDTVEFTKRFADKIEHVHWKDLPRDMESQRGKVFGCGMASIPLGSGVIDIAGIYDALISAGFVGNTTLEVAGDESVIQSREYLQSLMVSGE